MPKRPCLLPGRSDARRRGVSATCARGRRAPRVSAVRGQRPGGAAVAGEQASGADGDLERLRRQEGARVRMKRGAVFWARTGGREPCMDTDVRAAPPSWRARLALAVAIGVGASVLAWPGVWPARAQASDFEQLWHAAHALLDGASPYGAVGPGRAFDWPFPLLYPLPAVLTAVPALAVSPWLASVLFAGISGALLGYALLRVGIARLPVVASFSFWHAAAIAQWSPVLTAAALIPGLGALFVVKPTVGAARFAYRPSARIMLLRRPNEGAVPALVERGANAMKAGVVRRCLEASVRAAPTE